ncbi:hypothetical protein GCM10010873_12880 [Cypionkella aquatica]|uniref:Uncharacterized protein n=1 Tax=Cypionkella aquatica TaxID=1756042 RepID=A0AA37WZZ8_9RHOB|nr:hypothetical protein [Cypionkella aquatica]GLS86314.1 hypothetical protein GCM10010873_12880 [Cypionkella aquatica]
MKGVQIFSHSLRQVMDNLGPALKVSGVLYLVQVVVTGALGYALSSVGVGGMSGGLGLGAVLVLVISLITGIWIAVAWHRYVLLGEVPAGFVPPFMGERMGQYFIKSLLIGLVLMVLGAILGMIVGLLFGRLVMAGGVFVGIVLMAGMVQVPMVFLGLRLAAALPGTALDQKPDLLAGWRATEGDWRSLVQLAVIMTLALVVVNLISFFVFGGYGVMATLWQVIAGWPVMMVGLSILTTLYGHYIERRPLV